ncbi:MAG: hypothetical protein QOJ16_3935, partial [Acidobacteriota bacterium]|nr:hypothetical protein [Acidobacteriota bacterium]
SAVLGVERVGRDDNFFALGGDSILSLQVTARAQSQGLRLNPRQVFEHPTVAELARVATAGPAVAAEQGPVVGEVALLPIQHAFFAGEPEDPDWFNLSVPLELAAAWPPAHLARALTALAEHHDALRARFERRDGVWRQKLAAPGVPVPWIEVALEALPAAGRPAAMAAVGEALQSALDLAHGPIFAGALFTGAAGARSTRRVLLLACHHLVVDHVSWQILLEDLVTACEHQAAGAPIRLPRKTTSVAAWARGLIELAGSRELAAETPYWLDERRLRVRPLPVDDPLGSTAVRATRTLTFLLAEEPTRRITTGLPAAYRMQIHEGLLATLAQAFRAWTGEPLLLVDLEGHGREEDALADRSGADLARTVGWLATLSPALLDLSTTGSQADALKAVKEQLRGVPRHGLGYGLLRFLAAGPTAPVQAAPAAPAAWAAQPAAEVLFNYGGQLDAALPTGARIALSRQPLGAQQSPRARRTHAIEINSGITGGRLEIAISYAATRHRPETIERLAAGWRDALGALAEHLGSGAAGGLTPSDFPLAGIAPTRLDELAAEREIEDLYPLSPLQEGMLFHASYAPEAGVYMAQMVCEIEGELDAAAFAAAWRQLTVRHPALRTSFHLAKLARPLQLVEREPALDWREEDETALDPAEAAARLAAYLAADRERGFDLTRAPLSRLLLLRRGERAHRLVWSFHQIQVDGWSLPILLREVGVLYRAAREGRTAPLPRARPYRDYIAWLARRDVSQAEAFWRRELAGFTGPTPLPGQLGGLRRAERETAEVHLSAAATAALQAAARRTRVTLNTLLQAAWGLLLARESGEPEAVFGATTSGRPADLAGVEGMVGLFINTLPVRVPAPEGESVERWLGALQDRQAEMRQFEWTALSQIQRWSGSATRSLFESFLVFQNYPLDREALAGAGDIVLADLRSFERSHYLLTLVARPGRELALEVAWDRAALDGLAVRRALGRLVVLCQEIAGPPDRALGELSLLSAPERHQLLVEWNDTARPPAAYVPVTRRIDAWAERTPGAVALRSGSLRWTYADLARQTHQLARRLLGLGVGPEARVGLLLERSPEQIVATIATWKAGGATLPCDPTHPFDRLAFMLEEAEVAVLVCTRRQLASSPELARLPVPCWLLLDEDVPDVPDLPDVPDAADPARLAYLIYTSGTTGRPKAVLVEQGHLAHTLKVAAEALGLAPGDSMPSLSPPSFDISLFDSLAPLTLGGTTVVLAREEVLDLDRLAATLSEVDLYHAVPSLQRRLVDHMRARSSPPPARLRGILCGGDAVPSELLRDLAAAFPACEIAVLYGPTEATILATAHRVPPGESRPRGLLGRPYGDVRLRVVDSGGRPAPIGVAGELWIGGGGVARGYLRRDELTRERFVHAGGERWYRTGDRVRYLADGQVEFLGRIDDQVKIRGFRIELAEIESVLVGHPGVCQAVVTARDAGDAGEAERRLVAYFVPASASAPTASELHAFLAERLPEFMLPAVFMPLAELPLSAHGKIDRASLPDPSFERPDLATAYVPPRGEVEAALAALWGAVLRAERVGMHDNFFELGGDSILGLQIVARAQQADLAFSVRDLFEHPTIAGLAPLVVQAAPRGPAEQGAVVGAVPLLPIQLRFFAEERSQPHWFAMSVLLEVAGLQAPILERALVSLVEHHDALRSRFQRTEAGWSQEIVPPEEAPLVVRDLDLSRLEAPRRGAALAAAGESLQAGFDLTRPPLLGAALFDLGTDGERLLLTAHHLVVDAVSWRILLEDLATAYRQAESGAAIELPAKTSSVQAWASAIAGLATSEELAAEAGYWLAASPAAAPLPADFPAGVNANASARVVATRLARHETSSLLTVALEAYRNQVPDLLLAALARCLVRFTGGSRIAVDLEGHGREEIGAGLDLTRTVGWLTTLFPVELAAGDSEAAALVTTKETLRALPRHGLGYGVLRWLTGGPGGAALAARPVPAVGFNYLGRLDAGTSADLRLARDPIGAPQGPREMRAHPIEVNAQVLDGQLEVDWSYSSNLHRRETIAGLADLYLADLRALIAHCLERDSGSFTPSDFPLAGLAADELAALLVEHGGRALATPRSGLLEDLYPLSPAQEGMLFHSLLERAAYFEQVSARLEGAIDPVALRSAWQSAVDRHPILRTAISWQRQDRPLQVVHRRVELPWREEDWRGASPAECSVRLAELLR